jgi:3-mercaptopyruvate sulfurtransferase SseA
LKALPVVGLLIILTFLISCNGMQQNEVQPITKTQAPANIPTSVKTTIAISTSTTMAPQITTDNKPPLATLDIARIVAGELKQKIDNGDYLILIDARKPKSFDCAYLPEARNIPSTPTPMIPLEEIKMLLNLLPVDVTIVFYGDAVDDADAAYLGQLLLDIHTGHKLQDLRVLAGGYSKWWSQGYPIRITPGYLV